MSGLYIHIPFCHSKCSYCDFYSCVNRDMIDRYIEVLIDEWNTRRCELSEPVHTVYIGGGTPSIMSADQLNRLFRLLPSGPEIEEYTIEVNPEDVDPPLIELLSGSPVNRVSMGIQSLDDSELAAIGRRHSAADAITAARRLIEAFPNTSVDLMFGIPGQTIHSWRQSIRGVLSLRPAHISAYSLMLEPGTRLYTCVQRGDCQLPTQEANDEMYRILCHELREAGYLHYEISNFALPDRQSRHNSRYWDFTPYLGIGASAHSYDGTSRRTANVSSLHRYLSGWQQYQQKEILTIDEQREEYIMLSLRRSDGLNLVEYEHRFGTEAARQLIAASRHSLDIGRLTLRGTQLHIPENHWLISDPIILSLI
ncbi:MAG: radical SAM family heme chaperone HemW [Paramuribaculum sp.]|nr:radical SAM family heme chaperone HemW [Paramuribaculum sp.]